MRGAQEGRSVVPVLWPIVGGAFALTWVACAYQPVQKAGAGGDSTTSASASTGTSSSSASSGTTGAGGATGSASTSGTVDTTAATTTASSATGSGGSTGSGAGGSAVDASASGGAGGSAIGTDASAGGGGGGPPAARNTNLTYTRITIHNRFLAEAVAIGDYNKDGILDIAAGRRWYAGPFAPNYNVAMGEHAYREGHEDLPTTGAGIEINTGVSDSWSAFAYDIDGDSWDDIIQITASDMDPRIAGNPQGNPLNAGTGTWFQNPKNVGTGLWTKYQISADMKGEHKAYADMTGDGKPEILGSCKACNPVQTWGYWQANWANPTAAWTFHPVTRTYTFKDGCCGWLHGLGAGDVNGDGKLDLLERSGVWLQPANGTGAWQFYNIAFSEPQFLGIEPDIGGGQMYAYDVDGDGLNDVVTSLNSHGYGLAWFKQGPPGTFTRMLIMNTPAQMAMFNNFAVSQLHTVGLEDMDGDGLKDIVTGKTFLAHPYETNDPGGREPVMFFVFKLVRTPTVHFEPHLIDADSTTNQAAGGAREFRIVDMNKDGILDIIVSSKRGLFVFMGNKS